MDVEATAPADESGSLSDHESAYRASVDGTAPPAAEPTPAAEPAADDDAELESAAAERDETGRFKPRHRAASQKASPEDVPRIRELTKRLRDTEAERDALKQARTQEPPARAADTPAAEPAPPAAKSAGFPSFDAWVAIKGNEEKTFEDFLDARADWRYDMRRAADKAEEATRAAQSSHQQMVDAYVDKLPAFKKAHPDFDEVVSPGGEPMQTSKVIEIAALQVGPEVAYYLATHPDELDALTADTLHVHPDNPAFRAVVASTRRYLSTLVAPEQRSSSSSRSSAAQTGSAPALASPTAPRPPNLVRTAGLRDADALPTDESSLADHERAWGPGRRRA